MLRRLEQPFSPVIRIAGLLILSLAAAGCAGMDRAPQAEPTRIEAKQDRAPAPETEPQQPEAKPEQPVAAKPVQVASKPDAPAVVQPAPKPDAPAVVQPVPPPAAAPAPPSAAPNNQVAAKPEAPAAKPAAKAAASPAPKKEVAAPPAPKPAAPTLDLAALEKRLKETSAIGVFTKLTLKNQVDALLDQFRGFYQGRIKTTLTQLRQPYDQLLMKVLSLLQDSDPPLAREITQSREAIWGILSDPDKFKNL